ncbi:MAG: MMPL family transporter [Candidatus Thermoplasmatota archaeon]|nr:MMPL family transporter [Candidatus Thermoplasmatota archaeon]
MLPILGRFIQRHPWMVVITILLITIGFSLFIPSLEFKTDFNEFTPDDELVKANDRVKEYFGQNQQLVFLLFQADETDSILSTEAIRTTNQLQNTLSDLSSVNGSFSLITFLDIICLIEFGQDLEECTDEQIQTAVTDLLEEPEEYLLSLFSEIDPNEEVDYEQRIIFKSQKTADGADIKSCSLEKTDSSLIFTMDVYDLSELEEDLTPLFPRVNVMEWYIGFENLITPIKYLDIDYQIAAHIEPSDPLWIIGNGFSNNFRNLFSLFKNRSLFNSYSKEVYLWITPPGQDMKFPIPLESGLIEFNRNQNQIQINVSLEELETYGIAPQFGSFSLPAKLSNFTAGTRYYQTSMFKRLGGRIGYNTSYLFEKLLKIQSKPALSSLVERMLSRMGNISWQNFDEMYETFDDSSMLPDVMALKDILNSWDTVDRVPDSGIGTNQYLFIVPAFYNDIASNSEAFLSKEYKEGKSPQSTLVFLNLEFISDYDKIISVNERIVEEVNSLNEDQNVVQMNATGNGVASAEINELTTSANQFIAPMIFIIIVIVLFVNFRKPSYVILPMLTLVVSTIWLFGSMVLFGIAFNVIAVALVPLVLGLGVDYSVHLLHNYRVEIEDGKDPGTAIKNSVTEIGTAMFLAMLTTVIAFLSFLTASFPPLRDFGILLALGVIFTFITSLTLLASLRYILDRRKTVKIKRKTNKLGVQTLMRLISAQVIQHQKTILAIMIVTTLIFSYGAIHLDTGYDMQQFAPEDTPAFKLFDKIAKQFPFASQNQEYVLIEGNVATVDVLSGIKKTHENLENDKFVARNPDGSLKITSIYTIIKQAVANNQSLSDEFNINPATFIPNSDKDVEALFDYLFNQFDQSSMSIDEPMDMNQMDEMNMNTSMFSSVSLDSFGSEIATVIAKEDDKYKATVIRVYINTLYVNNEDGDISDDLELLKNELMEDASHDYGNANVVVTGQNIISLTITNSLTESQIVSTIVSIVLAAFVLILVYRSGSLGIIALIPVGFSIVWILGTMYYIGYTLNALTITVTSITIGIGIDYAIHATERFRYIVDKTGNITKAVCETISHTGGALLIAALTTALGFGVLIFAPIPPQQQFGLILSVTIVYSFLTSIFILPLVLFHWANHRKQKYGYVVNQKARIMKNGEWVTNNHDGDTNQDTFSCNKKIKR